MTQRATCFLLTVLIAAPALALPSSKAITFGIHATRSDPSTQLLFTYRLDLKAIGQDKNAVMWRVTKVTITDVVAGQSWDDSIPEGAVSDWKIEHADGASPVATEFASPPRIERTAIATVSGNPAANYMISGRSPASSPIWFFIPHCYWKITVQNEQSPRTEGNDELIFVLDFIDTF